MAQKRDNESAVEFANAILAEDRGRIPKWSKGWRSVLRAVFYPLSIPEIVRGSPEGFEALPSTPEAPWASAVLKASGVRSIGGFLQELSAMLAFDGRAPDRLGAEGTQLGIV